MRATFLIGITGGVLVFGSGTMSMTQCTFRKSAFAGIYCKDTAFVSTANCHFISWCCSAQRMYWYLDAF